MEVTIKTNGKEISLKGDMAELKEYAPLIFGETRKTAVRTIVIARNDPTQKIGKRVKPRSAPQPAKIAPSRAPARAPSHRIFRAPKEMMTAKNQINYKTYLGVSGQNFVRANAHVATPTLVKHIVGKLPVQSSKVVRRVTDLVKITKYAMIREKNAEPKMPSMLGCGYR